MFYPVPSLSPARSLFIAFHGEHCEFLFLVARLPFGSMDFILLGPAAFFGWQDGEVVLRRKVRFPCPT